MDQKTIVCILLVLLAMLVTGYVITVFNQSSSETVPPGPTTEFPITGDVIPSGVGGGEPLPGTTVVNVYYYDAARDTENGNVLCSARGLVGVPRTIAATDAPLRAALESLLAGEPAGAGLEPFPMGVILERVSVSGGVATIALSDPLNRTSGGSCRVAVLRAQLEATALQFSSVSSVRVEPDTLFQP